MAGKVVAGRKTEEAAAGCSVGEKAGDAALVGGVTEKEKIAADAAGDGKIYFMSQEQVDYILSWDLEEDTFHRCDDDSDAWKKGCDFSRKSELELLQYQKKVREEYETYGFVRVEYDEEEEERSRCKSQGTHGHCRISSGCPNSAVARSRFYAIKGSLP
jgi:hypothetical protein